MNYTGKILAAAALVTMASALLLIPQLAASRAQQMAGMQHAITNTDEPVPAFHAQPAEGDYPPTMDPALFSNKMVFNAYTAAGRVKSVLYQQPCYCHCDRSQGHGSLLDCFVSRHGSGCDICMKEAFYSYEQTHLGKTPAQIREGILHGDWEKVDTVKYKKDYLPPAAK
jgi:hypothetical protein